VSTTAVGTAMDPANVRRDLRRALALVPGIEPGEWTPRELWHSLSRCCPIRGIPVEQIAQLVGHSGTTVTELVYRHQLRPCDSDRRNRHGQAVCAWVRVDVVRQIVRQRG